MWPFRAEKNLKDIGIFSGFTDWHSHILPGVDDGVKTIEESIGILREYENLGFKKVWLTPHIMEDYPNTPHDLRKRFEQLKDAWDGELELHLAAENMLDSLFEQRLESGELLTIGDEGNHLLVETSYYTPPIGFENLLERVKSKGFFPILAHPERYRYMDSKTYEKLKGMGILFQMNLASLLGGYGETARKKAEWLLDNEMIDYLGSDIHRIELINLFTQKSLRKKKHTQQLHSIIEKQK